MTAPDSQLFNFLSVSRLLDEKFQELDREVFCSADICVQREEQWRENAIPWSTSADSKGPGCEF